MRRESFGVAPLANAWNDDRFGSVLDKLYAVDRASLMTELVESYVEAFSLELIQLHNDSTTVKAFGRIPGKTANGLELKHGISKDHRDDLRQLVFNLSLTADGGVPIHHRCYPGNYTDDKTHIQTWNTLRRISGRTDFLYVGDSKLCTGHQLHAIVSSGGRVVTILKAADNVLATHHVRSFMTYEITTHTVTYRRQIGKGRPSKHTKYRDSEQTSFSLSWRRDRTTLRNEARIDGIFPLLCTDTQLDSINVLKAYKYQPRLEKRFSQFKSIHNAAPLLFKKNERVEANMFAFFIALAIQSLLERQVRDKMTRKQIDKLYIYPEDRECKQPTASIIFDRFANVSK